MKHLLIFFLLYGLPAWGIAQTESGAYSARAGVLLKLCKQHRWPNEAGLPHWTIGLLGADSTMLQQLQHHLAKPRAKGLALRVVSVGAAPSAVQILYGFDSIQVAQWGVHLGVAVVTDGFRTDNAAVSLRWQQGQVQVQYWPLVFAQGGISTLAEPWTLRDTHQAYPAHAQQSGTHRSAPASLGADRWWPVFAIGLVFAVILFHLWLYQHNKRARLRYQRLSRYLNQRQLHTLLMQMSIRSVGPWAELLYQLGNESKAFCWAVEKQHPGIRNTSYYLLWGYTSRSLTHLEQMEYLFHLHQCVNEDDLNEPEEILAQWESFQRSWLPNPRNGLGIIRLMRYDEHHTRLYFAGRGVGLSVDRGQQGRSMQFPSAKQTAHSTSLIKLDLQTDDKVLLWQQHSPTTAQRGKRVESGLLVHPDQQPRSSTSTLLAWLHQQPVVERMQTQDDALCYLALRI